MKQYEIKAFRRKIVYEECEFIVKANSLHQAEMEADNILMECSTIDGSHPADMDWEENGNEEWDRELSRPIIDEIKEAFKKRSAH